MPKRKSWESYLLFLVRQMPADVRSEYIDQADEVLKILVRDGVIVFSHPCPPDREELDGETLPLIFH